MKKSIRIIAIILLLGIFLVSGWNLTKTLREYRKSEIFYEDLTQYLSEPETEPAATEKNRPTVPEETLAPQPEVDFLEVDFVSLQAINPDIVGWVYVPDTQINYPVVQGSNNDQYLYRLPTGEYNASGSIFLDAAVSRNLTAKNNPIYGHNMKNGSMFAGLKGYTSQEFFDAHPKAYLVTAQCNYVIHLFSGYVADTRADAWKLEFTQDEYALWLEQLQRKSYFASDVIPNAEDRVVTFSTCTYETDDSRFLVHGILEAYPKA